MSELRMYIIFRTPCLLPVPLFVCLIFVVYHGRTHELTFPELWQSSCLLFVFNIVLSQRSCHEVHNSLPNLGNCSVWLLPHMYLFYHHIPISGLGIALDLSDLLNTNMQTCLITLSLKL